MTGITESLLQMGVWVERPKLKTHTLAFQVLKIPVRKVGTFLVNI